jgi:hypothetical protein
VQTMHSLSMYCLTLNKFFCIDAAFLLICSYLTRNKGGQEFMPLLGGKDCVCDTLSCMCFVCCENLVM